MDARSGFWTLAMRFHQDVLMNIDANETALADFLIRNLAPAERQEIARFLDAVLAMPDAGDFLLKLWNRSQADFRLFARTRLRRFLRCCGSDFDRWSVGVAAVLSDADKRQMMGL